MFFAENPGKIEVVPWYADNEICCQEIRFSIPPYAWSEFLKSDLFRELQEYVDSLETQDKHMNNREPERKAENVRKLQNLSGPDCHVSFSVRVRKWIAHKILRL